MVTPLATLLVAGLSGWIQDAPDVLGNLTSDEPSAPVNTVAGSVTKEGGGPHARAAVVSDGDTAKLVLTVIVAPPEGRLYQAWVERRPSAPTAKQPKATL